MTSVVILSKLIAMQTYKESMSNHYQLRYVKIYDQELVNSEDVDRIDYGSEWLITLDLEAVHLINRIEENI